MSQLKIEPVPGLTLGAVVTGVDLATLYVGGDETTWAKVEEAFNERHVLVFPNQGHLSLEQQVAFMRHFGEPENLSPTKPGNEHYVISNKRKNGQLLQEGSKGYVARIGTEVWHMDSTFVPVQTNVSCLMAMQVPSLGGETEFADMQAGYEAFDEKTKEKIKNLCAYHSGQYSSAVLGVYDKLEKSEKIYGNTGDAYLRPLVKYHPATGKPSFFAARHAFGIPGMAPEESEQFLEDLNQLACQPPRIYSHSWKVGDVVLWDNRCTLHRARPFDVSKEPRILRGVRMSGDPKTESAILGTPEASQGRERLVAEVERLKQRKNFVFGKTLPRAAL